MMQQTSHEQDAILTLARRVALRVLEGHEHLRSEQPLAVEQWREQVIHECQAAIWERFGDLVADVGENLVSGIDLFPERELKLREVQRASHATQSRRAIEEGL